MSETGDSSKDNVEEFMTPREKEILINRLEVELKQTQRMREDLDVREANIKLRIRALKEKKDRET